MAQLLFPILICALTSWGYRNKSVKMLAFYRCMTLSNSYQKLYAKLLLFSIIAFHAVYSLTMPLDYSLMASTAVFLPLCSTRRTLRLLGSVREDKRMMFTMFIFILFILLVLKLYTISVTLAFILLFSIFWPSLNAQVFSKQNANLLKTDVFSQKLLSEYFR